MKHSPVKTSLALFGVALLAVTSCGGNAAAESEGPAGDPTGNSLSGEVSETISGLFSSGHEVVDSGDSIDRVPALDLPVLRDGEGRELTEDEHDALRIFVRNFTRDFGEGADWKSDDMFYFGGSSHTNTDGLHVVTVGLPLAEQAEGYEREEVLAVSCELARGLTLELVEEEIPIDALGDLHVEVATAGLPLEESGKEEARTSVEVFYDLERHNRYRSEHC